MGMDGIPGWYWFQVDGTLSEAKVESMLREILVD